MPALHDLAAKYEEQVAFFLVYIREAHASDAWQVGSNERDAVIIPSPTDIEQRTSVAQTCAAALEIQFPVLVDGFDNAVDEAYAGWPERIYLVGKDGRIAYMGEPGPFGFAPEDLAEALAGLLGGDAR